MRRRIALTLAGLTAVTGGVVGGALLATPGTVLAQDETPTATAEAAPTDSADSTTDDGTDTDELDGADRPAEEELTGDIAAQVEAAALAASPGGEILRVETDNDGVYEAHVIQADGTEVVIKIDEAFSVTAIEEHGGRGHGRGEGCEDAVAGSADADNADDTDGVEGSSTTADTEAQDAAA